MAFRGLTKVVPLRNFARIAPFRNFSENTEHTETPNPGNESKAKELETRIKSLEAESLKYKDFYIRALAEQENLSRRLRKEIENEGVYSITKFAKEVLEVNDNLSRAIENTNIDKAKENPEKYLKELVQGVDLTKDVLKGVLTKFHISEYCPAGEKFNPNLHEALLSYEDKGKEPGTVGQVFSNGFMIKDRVLRVAKVGVVKK